MSKFTYDHMNLSFLFYLATLQFQKRQQKRFTGKRAPEVLRKAQAKRVAAGKTAYFPTSIV